MKCHGRVVTEPDDPVQLFLELVIPWLVMASAETVREFVFAPQITSLTDGKFEIVEFLGVLKPKFRSPPSPVSSFLLAPSLPPSPPLPPPPLPRLPVGRRLFQELEMSQLVGVDRMALGQRKGAVGATTSAAAAAAAAPSFAFTAPAASTAKPLAAAAWLGEA